MNSLGKIVSLAAAFGWPSGYHSNLPPMTTSAAVPIVGRAKCPPGDQQRKRWRRAVQACRCNEGEHIEVWPGVTLFYLYYDGPHWVLTEKGEATEHETPEAAFVALNTPWAQPE